MNVAFQCRQCEHPVRIDLDASTREFACSSCEAKYPVVEAAISGDGQLKECLVCGCQELFVRKDFNQRLGVTIVVVGLLASFIAWGAYYRYVSYAILFGTALIDLVLYFTVKNMLQCYRCEACYRGLSGLDQFEPFDLETHEKFRQQAIRLAQARQRQ